MGGRASTYPDAGGVVPSVAEQRGDVPAHLAHLRLAAVPQQLHPRRRHARLRLAGNPHTDHVRQIVSLHRPRETGGGTHHLDALKELRRRAAARREPASRRSARTGDRDSLPVGIIIVLLFLLASPRPGCGGED